MRALRVAIAILSVPFFSAFQCDYDERGMTEYTPIIMNKADLPASIFVLPDRTFKGDGKIYIYGNYICVVERYRGIHVVDNTDDTKPTSIGFINIAGVVDIAVKDNILYADNAVDLVAIDISGFPQISVVSRVENVFPELTPPDLPFIPHEYASWSRPANTVIVGWVK